MKMNTTDGIIEHNLEVTSNGHRVPAVLWLPAEAKPPLPLVLVGHGGGGHKKAAPVVSMAQGLIQEHGIAALAIDGPVNGDREANSEKARQIRQQDRHEYRRRYYQEKYDEMVQDWRDALTVARGGGEDGRRQRWLIVDQAGARPCEWAKVDPSCPIRPRRRSGPSTSC